MSWMGKIFGGSVGFMLGGPLGLIIGGMLGHHTIDKGAAGISRLESRQAVFFTATFALLKNTEGITKIRGKWVNLNLNNISVPTLPTFHPAFLLRQPAQKKHVWEDLKSLKNKVSN